MAELIKRHAAIRPNTNGITTLFQVPADKALVVSTLVVCNQGAGGERFTVCISSDGTLDEQGVLYFEAAIDAGISVEILKGMIVEEELYIAVQSSSADMISYSLFGSLIDQTS